VGVEAESVSLLGGQTYRVESSGDGVHWTTLSTHASLEEARRAFGKAMRERTGDSVRISAGRT
jgi:hypothetical protein